MFDSTAHLNSEKEPFFGVDMESLTEGVPENDPSGVSEEEASDSTEGIRILGSVADENLKPKGIAENSNAGLKGAGGGSQGSFVASRDSARCLS